MTKSECPNGQRIVEAQFDIRTSDFFRHLTFDIRISPLFFPSKMIETQGLTS